MEHEKKYTAKQAALAVLKKTEELLKAHKHVGWGKLHGKLEREGYSDKSADKIAGSIKAKVEKSEEHEMKEKQGVQPQLAPEKNPAENRENGNPAPGALPQNEEKYGAELKGHIKLAKFMGRMEHKKGKKAE